jgi:hypothetical protein
MFLKKTLISFSVLHPPMPLTSFTHTPSSRPA